MEAGAEFYTPSRIMQFKNNGCIIMLNRKTILHVLLWNSHGLENTFELQSNFSWIMSRSFYSNAMIVDKYE